MEICEKHINEKSRKKSKTGEKNYTFTPEELSELLNKAFADGYQYAKSIYYMPEVTTNSWDAVKETEHGTN